MGFINKNNKDIEGQGVITAPAVDCYEVVFLAAHFGSIDRVCDRLVKGCFSRTLADFKKHPVFLYNHNGALPIAKLSDIVETDAGLQCTAVVENKGAGAEYLDNIRKGIDTHSFGFRYVDIEEKELGLNDYCFDVKDVELYEVSTAPNPCNINAKVLSVKKL
jgi:HK97 family phage prohead protease